MNKQKIKHYYYDKLYKENKDKIGSYPYFWTTDKKEKRNKLWKKQREKYGFDDRETWNLDYAFIIWVYERFSMYRDIGGKIVDLEYHKFNIDGLEYSQRELINKILSICENLLMKSDDWEEDYIKQYNELLKCFSAVIPAMWW